MPLTSALVYSHTTGSTIGNIPSAIKQACILMTTAFLKARGDSSMTMQITTAPAGTSDGASRYGTDIKLALDIVDKYRRIR